MYGMTDSGRLSYDELTERLIKSGFIKYQYQMSIYYKYAPDVGKQLYYVGYCVYLYTSEALVKLFLDHLGKKFHVNFLGFSHWFILIRISQMKDHSI